MNSAEKIVHSTLQSDQQSSSVPSCNITGIVATRSLPPPNSGGGESDFRTQQIASRALAKEKSDERIDPALEITWITSTTVS